MQKSRYKITPILNLPSEKSGRGLINRVVARERALNDLHELLKHQPYIMHGLNVISIDENHIPELQSYIALLLFNTTFEICHELTIKEHFNLNSEQAKYSRGRD